MANELSKRPWVIDTPSTSVLFTSMVKIRTMEYVDFTDVAHAVEVTDENDKLVAKLTGAHPISSSYKGWVSGLKVNTTLLAGGPNMQSGKLIINIE